jgi:hypothetical protein
MTSEATLFILALEEALATRNCLLGLLNSLFFWAMACCHFHPKLLIWSPAS